jgi:ABC-type transport system involved in cytochrome c biogenesis permease subunit
MFLAAVLGIALSFGWRALSSHRSNIANPFPFILAALVGVWAVNFFVLLPGISPAFIHLVPYPVSLVSKVLFGLAAAEAFCRQDASARKARPGPYGAEPVMITGALQRRLGATTETFTHFE